MEIEIGRIMRITFENYKSILPERLHASFRSMADRSYGREVHFINQTLVFR